MNGLAQLVGASLGVSFGLVIMLGIFMVTLGWPFLAFLAYRELRRIRIVLQQGAGENAPQRVFTRTGSLGLSPVSQPLDTPAHGR